MNAELLVSTFSRISNAPDAVHHLRRFILDLAVRGKLVDQDPNDKPVVALKGKNSVATFSTNTPAPFSIPPNWVWVPLGAICSKTGSGSTPRGGKSVYLDSGVPFLRSQNVHNDGLQLDDVAYISQETHERMSGTAVQPDDLLLNITGGSIGRCCLVPKELGAANISQHVAIIRVAIADIHNYLHRLVLSPYFQSFVISEQTGAGRGGLPKNRMDRIPVALPPLEEQKRIVANVEELMALCDQLEAAHGERENRRDRLTTATHHHLKTVNDDATLRSHADFFINHLPRLTLYPNQINPLRQTILNLAVRGKLVPQDSNDDPAFMLLDTIRINRLNCKREVWRQKLPKLREIHLDEAPFELPAGWMWARFPELGFFGRGKSKHRPRNDASLFREGTHLLIQTGDVARSNGLITTYTSKYNEAGLAQSIKWPLGTLCITIAANIADSGILSFDACFPDSVVGFIPESVFPNARYFEYFIRTAKASLLEFAPATAQKNINLEILYAVLIPLPPLAEQQRIVDKVDELMALCDQMEARLNSVETESSRLLESVLYKTLNPGTAEDANEAMHMGVA